MSNLIVVGAVESTMTTALDLFDANVLDSGSAILATWQSAGQGRLDRTWLAEPHQAVLMTAYRSVSIAPPRLGLIAIATGVAIAESLEQLGVRVDLKWPNDLLIDDRKLAGILIRTRLSGDLVHVFAGIGVNVLSVPGAQSASATCLAEWIAVLPPVPEIAELIRSRWNDIIAHLESGADEDLIQRWTERAAWIGEIVNIETQGTISGIMSGIDEFGRLLINEDGVIHVVDHGDVIRGPRLLSRTSYTDPGI